MYVMAWLVQTEPIRHGPVRRRLLGLAVGCNSAAATLALLFGGLGPSAAASGGAAMASSVETPGVSDGTWAPTASDPGFTFLYPDGSGGPAAWWSPCAPIRYAVDLSDAPAGALEDALAAVAVASSVSGLRFEYVGTTGWSPDPAGGWGQMPPGIDAVIGWAAPSQLSGTRAMAGTGGSWWQAVGSHRRIDEGYALVNGDIARAVLRPGFGTGYSEGHLLLHELGHMLGLGHTGDPTEVMYPQTQPLSPSYYGAGDMAGLAALGSLPCS